MNPNDEHDEVLEAYRKASAEKAGRPTAGMRRAILEEAAAAANRRRPAANDSRFMWRGIAGVAVLSVGIVLWRQVEHRTPGATPVVVAQQMREESKAEAAAPVASAAPAAPAPPPAAAIEERAAAKQAPRAQDAAEAEALLRLHFPAQYASGQPHTVWLVVDGAGTLLRSGELPAGQTLGELRLDIERELGGGRLLRPWRIHTLRNAQGQEIQLGVAQTP
ncbi:MAG: hypothetical protein ABW278_03645 [Steroidobacteraceae bacterium]